jgi:hypothetical protein
MGILLTRTVLLILATVLGLAAFLLASAIPVREEWKNCSIIATGMSFFFALFFGFVRYIDDYGWWMLPFIVFLCAGIKGFYRMDDIKRLIRLDQSFASLAAASTPITGAPMTGKQETKAVEAGGTEAEMADYWPDEFEHEVAEEERRFLDDFFIADEADLGPHHIDLEGLDEYVFTSRHAYLVHDRGDDEPVCDVMTITPGMSVADLVEASTKHLCTQKVGQA